MKSPTIKNLQRKNEMLQARITELELKIDKHLEVYRNNLYDKVDLQTKLDQIQEIVNNAS